MRCSRGCYDALPSIIASLIVFVAAGVGVVRIDALWGVMVLGAGALRARYLVQKMRHSKLV